MVSEKIVSENITNLINTALNIEITDEDKEHIKRSKLSRTSPYKDYIKGYMVDYVNDKNQSVLSLTFYYSPDLEENEDPLPKLFNEEVLETISSIPGNDLTFCLRLVFDIEEELWKDIFDQGINIRLLDENLQKRFENELTIKNTEELNFYKKICQKFIKKDEDDEDIVVELENVEI